MNDHPQEQIPATQTEEPEFWRIPSCEDILEHPQPLPNPERIATIIANVTKVWGPGDWGVEAGYYFKPTKHGAKCKSLLIVWNHEYDRDDPSINSNDVGPDCDGPGVPVYNGMTAPVLKEAIALSLEAAMQKLEYFTNYEERERDEEALREGMRRQYEEGARNGVIVSERRRRRERNDLLQRRLFLYFEIFGEAEY